MTFYLLFSIEEWGMRYTHTYIHIHIFAKCLFKVIIVLNEKISLEKK